MFLLISLFVLMVVVCSGFPPRPSGIQSSKGTFVTAGGLYKNRMKRSLQSEGLAAEDYLLSGAEPVQISTYSIVYTKPGGYNRAVADFEYLKPKSVRTTRWGKTGWTHFDGQVGDRTLILTVDDAKTSPFITLTRINQHNRVVYSQRFIYMSSKDPDTLTPSFPGNP